MLEFFRLSRYGACTKCTPGGTSAVASVDDSTALEDVAESSNGFLHSHGGAFLRSLVDVREKAAFKPTDSKGAGFTEYSVGSELTVDGVDLENNVSLEASVYGGASSETWLATRIADLVMFAAP
jgi:hypothetical protein